MNVKTGKRPRQLAPQNWPPLLVCNLWANRLLRKLQGYPTVTGARLISKSKRSPFTAVRFDYAGRTYRVQVTEVKLP